MTSPLFVSFAGGATGPWRVESIHAAAGKSLPVVERLMTREGADAFHSAGHVWRLRGVTSNTRYTRRDEVTALGAIQEGLARPLATRAAMIPIRKSAAWWALAQDERRAIFEEQSRHIGIGMDYLPAVARRLHHCRDLGEPFDFITWFEYEPDQDRTFDELLRRLRETSEWRFIDREVDVRLARV